MPEISRTFGIAACAFAAAMLVAPYGAAAKGFHVVYTFPNGQAGAAAHAGVIRDGSGNLYGSTFYGGNSNLGRGNVFKLAPDGTETLLYSFTGGTDGGLPAGLTMDAAGNLYGTTQQGGVIEGCQGHGCGVVFEIAAGASETVLYTFTGASDGANPQSGVILDKKGNLYGTTIGGGTDGFGTVFELTAKGKEKVLYSFAGGADGKSPISGLAADKAGNLFGTTNLGGNDANCNGYGNNGCGTVYEVGPDGTHSVLYVFTGAADGGNPVGGLLSDNAGNLYGTTEVGGLTAGCGGFGCGTVFKLAAGGALTTLYTFTGGSDGGQPVATLVSDSGGNLYGTTLFWGQGYGVVFALAPDGTESVLHSFTDGDDGAYPFGSLLKIGKSYYSTTSGGGAENWGTVFKVRK